MRKSYGFLMVSFQAKEELRDPFFWKSTVDGEMPCTSAKVQFGWWRLCFGVYPACRRVDNFSKIIWPIFSLSLLLILGINLKRVVSQMVNRTNASPSKDQSFNPIWIFQKSKWALNLIPSNWDFWWRLENTHVQNPSVDAVLYPHLG